MLKRLLPGLLGVVPALIGAAVVSAANLAPNPSFETLCNGNTVPCNWESGPGAAVVPVGSSTLAHSGARSMSVTTTPGYSGQGANSDCLAAPPAGAYTLSVWYNTSDPAASGADVGLGFYLFGVAGCTTAPSVTLFDTTPMVADGQWHQVTRTISVPGGQVAGYLVVGQDCVCQVRYDDIVLDVVPPTPTATALAPAVPTRTPIPTSVVPTPVIPEGSPLWLFGSGLLLLVGLGFA